MLNLSERQGKTIASGLTVLSFAVVFAFVAFVVWLAVNLLSVASAAVVPVALGFFLAIFFKPYYLWWKRLVRNPTLALALMLVTVLVPAGVFLWYAGSMVVDQIMNLVHQGPALVASVWHWLQTTFPKAHALLGQIGVDEKGIAKVYGAGGAAAMKAGAGAVKCLSVLAGFVLTLIFFSFFLMTRDRGGRAIVAELPILKDETKGFVATQIDAFLDILVGFFRRQTLICLIEGAYYGMGFALVGLPYGFLLGFLLGTINLIPLCGSVAIMPIALPLAYFGAGGSALRLGLVAGVWALGQFLDGYVVTPKIQGDKTGLGFAGVIFSFFFWASVLGPVLGMLLAIPLSAFCVVLWRAIKAKYLKPVV